MNRLPNLSNLPHVPLKGANKWNSAFVFREGFDTSPRFHRYCTKMQDTIGDYLYEESLTDKGKSVLGKEPVIDSARSFFHTLFVLDGMGEYLNEDAIDWRFNLIPMQHAAPYNMIKAPQTLVVALRATVDDDDIWQRLAEPMFAKACKQYLHIMFIRYPAVTDETYVIQAMPHSNSEKMEFLKLYFNLIWIHIYEESFEAMKIHDEGDEASLIDFKQTVATMRKRLEETEKQLAEKEKQAEETDKAHRKEIREMKESRAHEVNQQVRAYKEEFASKLTEARREAKAYAKELEEAKARIAELEEAAKIDEMASDDTEEHAPENTLDYNSRIVFVVSPPSNGRVERTFEKLHQRFPNSVFIHRADDCTPNADCYVLLTKYIVHHSLYNSARDMFARRGWAYIHSANQNVDIIAQDIFGKTRYLQTSRVAGTH